jgi:hypothetical protein
MVKVVHQQLVHVMFLVLESCVMTDVEVVVMDMVHGEILAGRHVNVIEEY